MESSTEGIKREEDDFTIHQFLTLAVNTVFTNCRRVEAEEEEDGDETDNQDNEKLTSVLENSKLSIIFSVCTEHIVKHRREHIKSIFWRVVSEFNLPEPTHLQ